jgi:hypothetical protein
MKRSSTLAATAVLLLSLAALPSLAQTPLPISNTVVNTYANPSPPTNCTSASGTGNQCAEAYGYLSANNFGSNSSVTANPTTYTIANTFNQSSSLLSTGSDFGASVYTPATSGSCTPSVLSPNCLNAPANSFLTWNFQDNYGFTTPAGGAQVSGVTVSFSLPSNIGLGSLEARIITDTAPTAANLVGLNSAGVVTIVDGWTNVTATTSGAITLYQAVLNTTTLAPNTAFFLQVRGEAGTAAGYSGSVTFTPVPLPGTLGMILSALIGLVALRRMGAGHATRSVGFALG